MADELPHRLGAALSDRYRLLHELGEGGMATVYLAEDLKHDRQVALKVLKPELAAVAGAERFLTEIKTTANLQHPHILPLFDSGEADSFLFYVMPFIECESLGERLDRERQLPVPEAVELAQKIADALDYAHGRGVVHRDVKPANVLLSERGEPLVADFGIALAVSQADGGRITETGLSMGTPHCMSPEQASGDRSVDRRSDIYALGCVLYEMLAGEPPYGGGSAQPVLAKILTEEPRRVTAVRRTVPRHVDTAVAHALGAGAVALGAGAVALVALAAFALGRRTAPEPVGSATRFRIDIPEGAQPIGIRCGPMLALSPDGESLVFMGTGSGRRVLYRRRLGRLEAEEIPGTEGATVPFFSPDGRRVAVYIDASDDGGQIWIWDRDQRTQQLLSVEGEFNFSPVWNPDGSRIAFAGARDGAPLQIYWQPADGSEGAERLLEAEDDAFPSHSSPDARWLAYSSDRSGQAEVYVRALDGTGGRTQISAGGGHSPRWAPDGGVLYYATTGGAPIMAAEVVAEERFRVLARTEAFEGVDDLNPGNTITRDVSPDGGEFLYISRGSGNGSQSFVWIQNWPEIVREIQGGGAGR